MTDWDLIRKLVNTAIDTSEEIERLGIGEEHRDFVVNGSATIHEFLMSSWVAPESVTRKIIGKSHELDVAKPYSDDLARTLLSIGYLSSELVKLEKTDYKIKQSCSQQEKSIRDEVEWLCKWYRDYCIPSLADAMERKETRD